MKGIFGMLTVLSLLLLAAFLSNISRPRIIRHRSCISILIAIDGAKNQWAMENNKAPTDVPAEADLFGPDRYMDLKPKCPKGGTYTIGAVNQPTRCSIPEHNQGYQAKLKNH